jgi:hypothetical protein
LATADRGAGSGHIDAANRGSGTGRLASSSSAVTIAFRLGGPSRSASPSHPNPIGPKIRNSYGIDVSTYLGN